MPRIGRRRIQRFIEPFRVKPGSHVRLPRDFDPGGGVGRAKTSEAKAFLRAGIELLADYQARLAAQDTYGLLVVLQAMDAAGKDGTIRHVMTGVNPQGVAVHGFKAPSPQELDHDFLWRYQVAVPERGSITIFNRSHYEEVLVVRVHRELLAGQKLPRSAKGEGVWAHRFRSINDWERHLVENGIHVVKLFLNVSRDEQLRRFVSRIDEPEKNWKFSPNDAHERTYWDDYQRAFADMLEATSTPWAPWFVIPADDKPFARVAAAAVIADALMAIDPRYPTVSPEHRTALETTRVELLAETGGEPGPSSAASSDRDRHNGHSGHNGRHGGGSTEPKPKSKAKAKSGTKAGGRSKVGAGA
jgi:PPK2 family polyphosphate:nucleotide phosphotransferase